MMSAIWKQTTEQLVKSIQDTIVAQLKIAAIRIVNGRLNVLLTGSPGKYGGGGGSLVITNWQDFVYGTAQKYAMSATNDFFTQIRSGIPNTLYKRIGQPAEQAVEKDICSTMPDAQNYVPNGDASQIFSSGQSNPWMRWRMMAMPQNDLATIYLCAEGRKQAVYQQQAQLQIAQGVSGQGYRSAEKSSSSNRGPYTATTSSGGKVTVPPGSDYTGAQNITTPGSTVKSVAEEILQMPMKMLEQAQTIPQVVTGMVNSMITQLIQTGVNTITAPIDQQIVKARNQAGQSLNMMQSQIQSGITNSGSSSGTRLFR
jgi:hypothetical protein